MDMRAGLHSRRSQQPPARLDDRDMRMLAQARAEMPGWMGDVVLKIGAARNG